MEQIVSFLKLNPDHSSLIRTRIKVKSSWDVSEGPS